MCRAEVFCLVELCDAPASGLTGVFAASTTGDVVFHAATELNEQVIEAVQASVRQRLRSRDADSFSDKLLAAMQTKQWGQRSKQWRFAQNNGVNAQNNGVNALLYRSGVLVL